uniref:Mitochondrial/ ribosomal s17-like protein n=1 Tax=Rhipicephalus zambeziensis TaxID=60191 RepID=A0A224Z353_9ACAR
MAALTSPALLLGKCVSSAVKKTVRVVVTRFELDTFLMAHYKKRTEYEVLDANEECEPGDWVLVKKHHPCGEKTLGKRQNTQKENVGCNTTLKFLHHSP